MHEWVVSLEVRAGHRLGYLQEPSTNALATLADAWGQVRAVGDAVYCVRAEVLAATAVEAEGRVLRETQRLDGCGKLQIRIVSTRPLEG